MNSTKQNLNVTILDYSPENAQDFARLNYEWLNQYFDVEPHDREMLDHPEDFIIKPGGHIFFAAVTGEIVGTTALIKVAPDTYELAKMGVSTKYRGLQIGQQLISHAIAHCRAEGSRRVVLESNSKLTAAIGLYKKTGFQTIPNCENSPYTRCDIRMELIL